MTDIKTLTELEFSHADKWHNKYFKYFCYCGNIFISCRNSVRSGATKSCGCLRVCTSKSLGKALGKVTGKANGLLNRKHGHKPGTRDPSPTYESWRSMKQRCLNPKAINYYKYGGKGITIYEKWITFEGFLEDMGERPSREYSIDRIDPNGNYEPGNCRWILKTENSRRAASKELV